MANNISKRKHKIFYPQDPPWESFLFQHHFNLLCDPRVGIWRTAILREVKEGDVVLELGSGTGILSMFAASRAKKVYAVEVDSRLVEYSRWAIEQAGLSDNITVINKDARELDLPEPVDLVIAEMLDTAMIQEPQVPVLREVLDRVLKPNGRVIPQKVITSIALAYCDYDFYKFKLPLPHFETTEVRKVQKLFSSPVVYHEMDFRKPLEKHLHRELEISIQSTGVANSLKIESETCLIENLVCDSSHWFNPPLVLPFPEIEVEEWDKIKVVLDYELGGGLKTLSYEVKEI
ncbi:MAG: methyltransferase domain-containing protein [Candidatus Eremiobacteraeota bacterium]|nr:methyltransferase domain-containing protein [Candidatus Eremiobacteraeota bacterium]